MLAGTARNNPIRKLGLGTVQFGHAYGISNSRGQVPLQDVRIILARAGHAGITLLDASPNYGTPRFVNNLTARSNA